MSGRVRIINLEEGFPTRDQAYQKLDAALARARKDGVAVLKVIHGYGSSGAGGVLRFAIRSFLRQCKEKREIAAFVNGESWSSFDERSKALFAKVPELVLDSDVGRGNRESRSFYFDRLLGYVGRRGIRSNALTARALMFTKESVLSNLRMRGFLDGSRCV